MAIGKSLRQEDFGSPSCLAAELLLYLCQFLFQFFFEAVLEVPLKDNTS
jgi:hypothetical protein